ncbi:MAG: hypothetical protein QOK43_1143 [Acidimicrobiaceae bacterium]|jgi:hypothetical protein|nr:hypothetical protein [Acidimicrobiaceae bacterium]MDQ1444586.1 hypothetical protein [Acidimicrobiaceae bacterium]
MTASIGFTAAILAHLTNVGGGGGGNSGAKLLMLVAGLGTLAAAARIRSRHMDKPPWLPLIIAVVGVLLSLAGMVTPTAKRPKIYLTLISPDPGATVPANKEFDLLVNVDGGKLAPSPTAKSGGHLHLYVDGKLSQMPYGTKAVVELPPGPHRLRIEYVGSSHVPYKPPIDVAADVTAVPQ